MSNLNPKIVQLKTTTTSTTKCLDIYIYDLCSNYPTHSATEIANNGGSQTLVKISSKQGVKAKTQLQTEEGVGGLKTPPVFLFAVQLSIAQLAPEGRGEVGSTGMHTIYHFHSPVSHTTGVWGEGKGRHTDRWTYTNRQTETDTQRYKQPDSQTNR